MTRSSASRTHASSGVMSSCCRVCRELSSSATPRGQCVGCRRFDVLPAVNGGDSLAAMPRLGRYFLAVSLCFLLHHPTPPRTKDLRGLHRRLTSPHALRRGYSTLRCSPDPTPGRTRRRRTCAPTTASTL